MRKKEARHHHREINNMKKQEANNLDRQKIRKPAQ